MTVDEFSSERRERIQRVGDCTLPLSEEACADLIARHGSMVKAACQRILGDAALAEDAAQEVFVLFVRKLPSLPPATIPGGWLYVTACQLARTHQRSLNRRMQREHRAEIMDSVMNRAQETVWRELEPLLDDAMLTLSPRQRELVLSRYFQNSTQKAAASLVGCSESVASRELAAGVDALRRFFKRHGVTVSETALVTLLTAQAANASMASMSATSAAALSAAAAVAGGSAISGPLFLGVMNTSTTIKIIGGVAALLLASGTAFYVTYNSGPAEKGSSTIHEAATPAEPAAQSSVSMARSGSTSAAPTLPKQSASRLSQPSVNPVYDETTLKAARERQQKFFERLSQVALMGDPLKIRETLMNEYGMDISVEEINTLRSRGPKGFVLGLMDLWPSKQPEQALAWAASAYAGQIGAGVDFHQAMLNGALKSIPNLNREMLDGMLPDGPGRAKLLDLIEAKTDPRSLANRVVAETDSVERAGRLRLLAQGWENSEESARWARENLTGDDRTTFYRQVGYNLAEQNPQAALRVLAELKGTEAYASTFSTMMRGLVQEGGRGREAAELIAHSELAPKERTELISELSRRWVRSDPDAAVEWVNTLSAPDDYRAAIPLLVSQLDNERVTRTVQAYLKSGDPVMESALIEAAAPESLMFDPQKSRLILDPLISKDPSLKIVSGEAKNGPGGKEQQFWSSVNRAAQRQAEAGQPAAAMEWLGTLPFGSEKDYTKAAGNVLAAWNLKSETEASAWLQNSKLSPQVKSEVVKAALRP